MGGRLVRCLRCGYEYTLHRHHRTVVQARVCPGCSYAGWEPIAPRAKGRPRLLFASGGTPQASGAGHRAAPRSDRL